MLVTHEQLHEMIPATTDKIIDKYCAYLNAAMEEFEINTPLRISAFIAQIAHESCNLVYSEELADGSAYEYRKDLGNLLPEALAIAHANHTTTGRFYKGHGLLQVTGYASHREVMEGLGIDCVTNPRILCEPEHACRSAAWFWHKHNLNKYADVGHFGKITTIINGGNNGAIERVKNYARCRKVLSCE